MVQILLIVLGLVALAIVAILILAAMKPAIFRVTRRTHIHAPPKTVFPFLNDFHRWTVWSPWERMDPNLKRTYSGAPSGVGSVYEWEGNKKVGKGRMEILSSTPSSHIGIKLDFFVPFEAHNHTDFTLTPANGGTDLVWEMHGPNTFMTKIMHTLMDMDKMVGKDFDAGLANLKAAAEA
jgi:hypothetical protein